MKIVKNSYKYFKAGKRQFELISKQLSFDNLLF